MKRWVRAIWWAVPIGAATYAGVAFMTPTQHIPPEFSEARIEGGRIAERIVTTSAHSLDVLEQVAEYDRTKKTREALTLVSEELLKTQELRNEAMLLSSQLERMARLLPEIEPTRARVSATEAVSSEVALVSHLISYNVYLSQLFEMLQAKFLGRIVNADAEVEKLIQKINLESKAINEFNIHFTQSLAEFDKIVLPSIGK